ncbi:MAG: PD-(D/E)XK nuclease family protein [Fimbriimonadaceae bacterium]
MPRKPSLSPSKLTTYLACPDKFKWTYVDDRGKWYLRSKSYYSFGSTLHGVLQRFHDEGDTGVTTTHQAVAALEESWIEAGYASHEEMMQAMSEGKAIIETYIENFKAQPVTAKTVYIEKLLRRDLGPFVLIGRLDRVDERDDGTLEVVDYKSGRQTVLAEDVATDLAMNCYALLLQERHPGAKLAASIVALRTGEKATVFFDPNELQTFQKDLVTLGTEVLERDFAGLVPVPKRICRDCDFLQLCSKHPEFDPSAISPE